MVTLDEGGWAAAVARLTPPPSSLRAFIEHVFVIDFRAADQREWRILPDTCGHVLVSLSTRAAPARGTSVVGTRTRAIDIDVTRREWTVGVRLRPGAVAALTRHTASSLTDRSASSGSVWGAAGDRLDEQLRGATDPYFVRARILDFLARRAATAVTPDWRAVSYAEAVAASGGRLEVGRAAENMGVSGRTLRAIAGESLGVPPKLYARIHRLFGAIASGGRPSWSRVAAVHGFADQAHLVREFRDLLGETPTRFLTRARSRAAGAEERRPPTGA